jgi:hypothetical protein
MQPHPEERQVIWHVEQLGALILREADDAVWENDLVRRGGAKIDGGDVGNDFHVGRGAGLLDIVEKGEIHDLGGR